MATEIPTKLFQKHAPIASPGRLAGGHSMETAENVVQHRLPKAVILGKDGRREAKGVVLQVMCCGVHG